MDTKELTAKQIVAIGRAVVVKHLPFISTAVYNLIPHEDPQEPTLSVTKRMVMSFNPQYVKEQGVKYIGGIILHEVSHVLRNHHERFERAVKRIARRLKTGGTTRRRDSASFWRLWNQGADLEINDGQPHALPLPPNVLHPSQFQLPPNKLAEWYFAQLLKQEEEQDQEGPSGGGSDGPEDEQEGASGGSGGADDAQDHEDGSGSGEPQDLGPGCGHCGSCAGPPKAHEPADGKLDGELGRSDIEMERIRDQVAEGAVQHFQKHAGPGAAGWLWWAQERLKPPVIRWQEQLDVLTRQAVAFREGFVDWRDDLIDEQQGALGWGPDVPLLPRLVAPTPEVMFLVDRSASMSGKELTEVAQEVPGVLQHLVTPLQFGSFDTTLKEIKRVRSVQEALKLFKGGGGTDFRPIFEYLSKPGVKKPNVLIIGTDGCGPAPAAPPPGISVIWLLVGKSACKPCNWGTFIWTDPAKRAAA